MLLFCLNASVNSLEWQQKNQTHLEFVGSKNAIVNLHHIRTDDTQSGVLTVEL